MNVKRAVATFALAATTLGLSGCDKDSAEAAVKALGYSDIKTEHSFLTGVFRCARYEDFFSYDFTAKNVKNETVSGYVCQAPLKGSTVRF